VNCFNIRDFSHFIIFSFSWNVFTSPSQNYPWLNRTSMCTGCLAPECCSIKKKEPRRLAPVTSAAQNMNFARNSKKMNVVAHNRPAHHRNTCTYAYIYKSKAVIISKSEHGNNTDRNI
jgi:hypothetical protein